MRDTPLSRYRRDLKTPEFQQDDAQQFAVERLQVLYDELVQKEIAIKPQTGLRGLWPFRVSKKVGVVRGVYLWGSVGRGKTYLMDLFFDCVPFEHKMRTHFHRFMRRIHAELSHFKGELNPLDKIASKLSKEATLICFDEFFVSDIADAMILGNLFKALFERGVVLVATSNIIPDRLYENGLQRSQFLPAIKLINQNTDVINVDGGIDYRLRVLVSANLYHFPLGDDSESALWTCFNRLASDVSAIKSNVELEVEGRFIAARYEADDIAWFEFVAICDGPRSQNDYIELAKEYGTVVISGVPGMGRRNDDQARRFVNLVDEFYDRRVKLVISSDRPLKSLYSEGKLAFEFDRTISRLLEMQSEAYLALPHRP